MKIHELLAELHNLILGFEVLKGVANGNHAKGSGVELGVSLHDIEGALRREGVAMMADVRNNFAFFGVRVSGEHKGGSVGGLFGQSGGDLGRGYMRRGFEGVVNESGGQCGEFSVSEDVGGGGRHVAAGGV